MRDETKKILREILSDNQQAGAKTLKDALRKRARAGYGPGQTPLNSQYEACLAKADDTVSACVDKCTPLGWGESDKNKVCLNNCYCNHCDNKYQCRVRTYAPNGGVIPQSWKDEAFACRAEYGCQGGNGPELESRGIPTKHDWGDMWTPTGNKTFK